MRDLVLDVNAGLSEKELADVLDGLMLAGPVEDMPLDGVSLPPMETAEAFAKAQNEFVRLHVTHGMTRRRGVATRELRCGSGWQLVMRMSVTFLLSLRVSSWSSRARDPYLGCSAIPFPS